MPVQAVPSYTPVPTPLIQRGDRATFSNRVDTFIQWLQIAPGEWKSLADITYNNATAAEAAATAAGNSQGLAAQAAASAIAVALVVSATPPPSPAQGATWVNADTGREYTYVNTTNGLRWIETKASVVYQSPSSAEDQAFVTYGVATPISIANYLRGQNAPVPAARGYWNEVGGGVNIHRLRDRVFIGTGATSSGNKIQTANETWLTAAPMGAFWLERGAQLLSISSYGQFGATFAARTSDQDLHNYGTAAIGVVGLANNDRTNGEGLAWAGYFEANRQSTVPAGAGTTFGLEIAVKNNNTNVINGPYNKFPGGATIGEWFAGGGDPGYNGAGSNPVTAAIVIGKNGTTWNKGLVFDALGLTGTDGVTGTGIAISMAKGHVVEWQLTGGPQGAAIRSEVTDNTKRTGMIFQNDSMWFTAGGNIVATIEKGAGAVNYLRLLSSAAGGALQIRAEGTDTDVDIYLNPKGSGAVRFGFWTASGDTAVNGFIGIKDAAGTYRKLATIA